MTNKLILAAGIAVICIFAVTLAMARDLGQWKNVDPLIADWFANLRQPDVKFDGVAPSCCGDADAYWADQQETDSLGGVVVIITDTRDDAPLRRRHIAPGTKFVVPPSKLRRPAIYNPTGHTVIFIGSSGQIYCYEPLPGI